MNITANHNDIIAVARFVRDLDHDMLFAIVSGETDADAMLVTLAHAEWRFRRPAGWSPA